MTLKTRFSLITAAAVLVISGCTTQVPSNSGQTGLISPGDLNLRVLPSHKLTSNCGVDNQVNLEMKKLGCVEINLDDERNGRNSANEYSRELTSLGWKRGGAMGNAFLSSREVPETGCSELVAIVARTVGTKGVLVFFKSRQPDCQP